MKKRVLSMAVFGLALMAVIYALLSYSVQRWLIVEMGITDESVVEVYSVPANNNFVLLNVIHHDIMDENLFFISKSGLQLFFTSLNEENDGMTDIVDIKFHEYKNKMFAEIAYSTNKGNGYIVLYEIEDEELEMLLTIQGAVDRNLDTTTNTVFGNGRMSVQLQESNMQSDMPKVIVEGTELVYGYSESLNYTGDELLYQRNHIQYEYEWNEEKETYDEVGKSRELLQQVD